MSFRIVAISASCPDYRPKVSRPLKEHETVPHEGHMYYILELLEDVFIHEVNNDTACFFWPRGQVEQLRDRNGWDEVESASKAA